MYYLLSLRVNYTDIMHEHGTNKQHIKQQQSLSLSNSSLSSSEEYKLSDTYTETLNNQHKSPGVITKSRSEINRF